MTVRLPLPTRLQAGFATVGLILVGWLLLWAYLGGKASGHEWVIAKGAYCRTIQELDACVAEQAPPGATVTCHQVLKGAYLCDANVGLAGCYAVTAHRTPEGFPVIDTAAEKNRC